MKKTLIALAAVAATSAAFAQSSVTLYGVADASIAKSTGSSAAFTSASRRERETRIWFHACRREFLCQYAVTAGRREHGNPIGSG